MKLIIKCNICNNNLLEVEKNNITSDDTNLYQQNTSCDTDGPFPTFDEDGNPLPMDYSNIVSTLTE